MQDLYHQLYCSVSFLAGGVVSAGFDRDSGQATH